MANNITTIVKEELCTGCGTCEGLCPEDAIKMEIDQKRGIYTPIVNSDKCTLCGVCFQVCPGHSVDFQDLAQPVSADNKYDMFMGNYLGCYTGYSNDENIRYNAASGGLVTQLLIFALNNGYIDGALVTRMRKNKPLEPEPFVARTREEIIEASQSKYCPVPLNIALKTVLQGNGRFAVVGLPCHLHGVIKAERLNPKLRKKIVLHLGIFCSHTSNFWGIQTFLSRAKIKPGEVSRLSYRGEGWPGKMVVSQNDGSQLSISYSSYYRTFGSNFFTPSRCLKCCDMTAELADLSFGDAWLREYRSDKIGHSILISRSEIGAQLIKQAVAGKEVELAQVASDLVRRAQLPSLYLKKRTVKSYIALSRNKPALTTALLSPAGMDYILSLMSFIDHLCSTKSFLRLFLKYMPSKVLTCYKIPYDFILSQQLKKFRRKILASGA